MYNMSNRTHHASDCHAQPGGTFLFRDTFKTYLHCLAFCSILRTIAIIIPHAYYESPNGKLFSAYRISHTLFLAESY